MILNASYLSHVRFGGGEFVFGNTTVASINGLSKLRSPLQLGMSELKEYVNLQMNETCSGDPAACVGR